MITLKCPKCQSAVEIDDHKTNLVHKTAVFCTNEECLFHKEPLIGLDRDEPNVYISESIV